MPLAKDIQLRGIVHREQDFRPVNLPETPEPPGLDPFRGRPVGPGSSRLLPFFLHDTLPMKRGEGGLLDGLLEVMGEMGTRHGAAVRIREDRILGNVSPRKRQKELLNYNPPRLSGLGVSKEDRS